MFPASALLNLYIDSPLHAGVGRQEGASVDLPIQREEATGYPLIRASSVKGTLRRLAAAVAARDDVVCVFGPEPEELRGAVPEAGQATMGALVLADARVLLFPVRSLVGVFAWVTSADLLAHFARDADTYGLSLPLPVLEAPPDGTAWVTPNSRVTTENAQLTLEELTFRAEAQPRLAEVSQWIAQHLFPQENTYAYWRSKVQTDVVVLPEDALRFFVVEGTELVYRIRLDPQTGVAQEGALWTEEYLPADTVLYLPMGAQAPGQPSSTVRSAADVLRWLKQLGLTRIQIGGSRSLGRGIVHLRWYEQGNGA
jgi:CRISPR-associated protein Cmr4